MQHVSVDIMHGEMAEERAERRVYEPEGMTKAEILEWYLEQNRPFRRRNVTRITELGQELLSKSVAKLRTDISQIPFDHPIHWYVEVLEEAAS